MEVEKLFIHPPSFETDRLVIRKFSLDDAADYFQVASNPIVTSQTTWNKHIKLEDSIN